MSKLIIALFVSVGLGLAGPALGQRVGSKSPRTPMANQDYVEATAKADAKYKSDTIVCTALSGNANDICIAEARGRESVAKAEAEAAVARTPMAREAARLAHTQADYDLAIEKCDRLAGNAKNACVNEAKVQLVKGTSDAKADRVTMDAREAATTRQFEARKEADKASRDFEYQVAIEKCDAQGTAKESCVSGAKLRFGRS